MPEQLPVQFEFTANLNFAAFYAGNNQEQIGHLKQFAEGNGERFIFLIGESGHGKTHLLHAVCQHSAQCKKSAIYLDLQDENNLNRDILSDLESMDIVCIDNIDLAIGDSDWEHALFHFFNRQLEQNQHLLAASKFSPIELDFCLPDLKTRLNWGLTLKLKALDDDSKINALAHKANQEGFDISPNTARFLLTHYDRKLSSLWSILEKLNIASLSAQRKLTIPFLKQILERIE